MNICRMDGVEIYQGDCLAALGSMPNGSAHTCITSPPYFGLRDYGVAGQIGLEETPAEYVEKLVRVFREVRRVLRDDGTLWLNLGDSYAGSWGAQGRQGASGQMAGRSVISARQIESHPKRARKTGSLERTPRLKNKDLIGIPWRIAFALQADGWYLRQDIIWHKPNPMPESVRDRCTKAHEYIFLLSKNERYYWDANGMQEPAVTAGKPIKMDDGWDTGPGGHGSFHRQGREQGVKTGAIQKDTRNRRSVWTVTTKPFKGAHFATFPIDLIEPCALAGSPPGGTVLDPFGGAGTTALAAIKHGRRAVLCELNPEYVEIAKSRINSASHQPDLFAVANL